MPCLLRHQLITAHFEKQPPENMRKSNFFNFIISMYDNANHPVEVHRAVFKDFYDTTSVSNPFIMKLHQSAGPFAETINRANVSCCIIYDCVHVIFTERTRV